MRIIKYKASDSLEFENYVDIGVCDRDIYFLDFFNEEDYPTWFENFTKEPMGTKMVIIHYFLSEYLGWDLNENTPQPIYFEDAYGTKAMSVISENLDYLLEFHKRWFHHESSLFKGLDLAFDDIEDSFACTIESDDGIRTEIELEDGSKIQFIDEDDSYHSFFVPEAEYAELKTDIDKIVSLFQP